MLVNDVWGGDPLTESGKPFWRRDLIVEVTDGDGAQYRGNLSYDLAKTAVNRLALAPWWTLTAATLIGADT